MAEQVRPDEAARALAEIEHRHAQVVHFWDVPARFWWVIAGLFVMFGAVNESGRPVLVGIGFAVLVLGMLTNVGWLLRSGIRRAQPRYNLMPRAGIFAMLGFVALGLAVQLTTVFVLQAFNLRYAAMIAALPNAALFVMGGPMLTRYLQGVVRANTPSGRR